MGHENKRSDEFVLVYDFIIVQVEMVKDIVDLFLLALEKPLQVIPLQGV